MKNTKCESWLVVIFCFFFVLTGCMNDPNDGEKDITIQTEEDGDINIKVEGSGGLTKAFQEAKDALGEAKESIGNIKIKDEDGKEVESVDFRDLKALLPNRAAGIKKNR